MGKFLLKENYASRKQMIWYIYIHSAFTCSVLTITIQEQGVKYLQS